MKTIVLCLPKWLVVLGERALRNWMQPGRKTNYRNRYPVNRPTPSSQPVNVDTFALDEDAPRGRWRVHSRIPDSDEADSTAGSRSLWGGR